MFQVLLTRECPWEGAPSPSRAPSPTSSWSPSLSCYLGWGSTRARESVPMVHCRASFIVELLAWLSGQGGVHQTTAAVRWRRRLLAPTSCQVPLPTPLPLLVLNIHMTAQAPANNGKTSSQVSLPQVRRGPCLPKKRHNTIQRAPYIIPLS